ncbi:unnamed protein product [Cylindrotheca closterium]|uniref:Transmembrane protein 43 n=1 Tax=Cylindrotheca closterium TaxID=2856 RepID=A0AAD2CPL1_9STRA|nr:unnamed protein product [Cylindrotheca closterium]
MSEEVVGDVTGYREVMEYSYFDRMKNALTAVCIGLLLLFGSWGVLFWNEGRSVRRGTDLDEGRSIVYRLGMTSIDDTINTRRDNELVYISGIVDGGNNAIYDEVFGLNVSNATKAIKYERSVQMYQWEERSQTKTEKTSDGGTRTVTTYTYYKKWSSRLIRSSRFKEYVTPSNPTSFLVPKYEETSNDISLGPFRVSTEISEQVDWDVTWKDAPIDTSASNFPDFPGKTATFSQGELRLQRNRGLNSIGDNKVKFSVVLPDYISVVAKQGSNGVLEPYITKGDRELLLFARGIKTSDELFDKAEQDNVLLTWGLRFSGFLTMVIGISLILNPIAIAFDVLPFCGDALEDVTGNYIIPCIALLVSIPMSLMIISIAWIFYQPLFAIGAVVMGFLLSALYITYFEPKLSPKRREPSSPAQEVEPQDKTVGDEAEPEAIGSVEEPEPITAVPPSKVIVLKVGYDQ